MKKRKLVIKEELKAPQNHELVNVERLLTRAEFQGLAGVPPEVEWFANIDNPNTRRGYENDVRDFMRFVGILKPEEFRVVTRPHVIAWRKQLEKRELGASTIRRKLSALSSLFQHLCECKNLSECKNLRCRKSPVF
jgi:integrase/recombinase XerD